MVKKKKSKKRLVGLVAGVVLIVIIIGIGAGFYFFKKSVVPETVILEIPTGADYDVLVDSLSSGAKISDIWLFDFFAKARELDKAVKPGHYELKKGMTANEISMLLRSGRQTPVNLIFNNIRTLDQLAGRFGEQLEADSVEFAALLLSDSVALHYGFTEDNFIAMFIPNTYQVYATTSPSGLLDRMKREYDKFWEGARDEKIARTGLKDREEVASLASIVMEESSKEDEFPAIAGVYINRIKKNIPLQADPTIIFAVGDPNLRRVRHRHLEIDSPYNTYKNAGVPPGPIRMPSIAAIDSVLDYQQHEYLFFCAKPDFSGYHAFAKTLPEHNKHARAYINALEEAGIR